jgi:glutathione S-transferase
MPTVHGVNASPFVRKVRVALAEKGIAYDLIPVMPMGQTQEFLAISPLGKIPVYQDGDFTLPDSSCIIAYLEKTTPEPRLYPGDAHAFGKALFYEEYADTRLAEVLGPPFVQRVVTVKIMKGELDQAVIEEALANTPPVLDYLESAIGDNEFLAGGHLSVADIAVATMFVTWAHAGETVDSTRWPKLAAYVERIHARPSFKAVIEEEQAQLRAMG